MEEDTKQYSLNNLEKYSYRYLQQMAKSMSLPSNVKKIYLIELINAHKFKTSRELNDIIQRVKFERKQQAIRRKGKVKKTRVQAAEITSTSNSSPPISQTPKRRSIIMTRSPDRKTIAKCNPENRLYNNSLKTYPSPSQLSKSDRVLRSFRDRPNYRIMNMSNAVMGVIKAQNSKATKISFVSQDGNRPKLNVTAFVKKQNCETTNRESQLMPYPGALPTPSLKAKQRRISGILPLTTPEKPRKLFTPMVQFTRRDGRMSTINALVQKQLPPQISYNREKNQTVTSHNTNHKVNNQLNTQSLLTEYDSPNTVSTLSRLSELIQDKYENCNSNTYAIEMKEKSQSVIRENVVDDRTEYYHKKIRAEHVRSVKVTQVCAVEERLPCINDVFSKFSDLNLRSLMEPIHVEVSEESEQTLNFPTYLSRHNVPQNGLLESLYNFRSQYITNQSLLQVAPKADTKCVYSTPTISSAMQQPTTAMIVNDFDASYMRDDQYENVCATPRVNDYTSVAEPTNPYKKDFTCNEVLSPSSPSSAGSSQELGANVTIPEMVEDALELISQDGDYMERIGMDVRMQCVLCDWAGPKFILEHHIRKEHVGAGVWCAGGAWCVRVALRGLRAAAWAPRLLASPQHLLLLRATYRDPHHFMAVLHTITSDGEPPKHGKITIYNKVTGEPYSWEGEVQELTDTIPSENDTNCFRIELSKINLLPNSANLLLINRELVVQSPTKVVVGSHALNDINIVMFVQYQ